MNNTYLGVCIITYNHEKFIAHALETVLMQKTTFKTKMYIGEDFSNDKTRDICLKYKHEYPEKIELILNKSNLGAVKNARNVYQSLINSGAKYIAFLEGDDYWTDVNKLQKQVDFLEANQDYALSCHNVSVSGDNTQSSYANNINDYSTLKDLATGEISIPALSVVLRNYHLDYPEFLIKCPINDFPLLVMYAQHGKIKYFSECMGNRRVHSSGLWSSADKNTQLSYMLNTLYHMIGNYEQKTNEYLISYHLKIVASSIKESVLPEFYPPEILQISRNLKYYYKVKKTANRIGLISLYNFFHILFKKK